MKKIIVSALMSCVLAVVALAGCGGSEKAAKLEPPYGLSGTVTMAEYQSKFVADFEKYAAGVKDGSIVPDKLELFQAEETSGTITDKNAMISAFNKLSEVRINLDKPFDGGIADGDIHFTFEWDGRAISFSFLTTEYANFSDGKVYTCEDSDTVKEVLAQVERLITYDPEKGEALTFVDGAYQWDIDNNGSFERLSFEFVDNGDEARSVMGVGLDGEGVKATGSIEGAYQVDSVEAAVDDKGPYAIVHYQSGDFYKHNTPATATLRVNGDKIEVTLNEK